MEPVYSSEPSMDLCQTARRYIPEESTLHSDRRESLKSKKYHNTAH
jgi:hypothetical protein